ncbi:outer membrane protein [Microvirga sp. 2YAF29]|uniref:outer membrane protein n=1 Tax=Microvirga sp. 2YAF29 TaxID=3233031 RepID=UPI003F9A52F5
MRSALDFPGFRLPPCTTHAGLSASALGGGAQVGYLWDFGSMVAGIEADLTALDVGRSRSFDGADGAFAVRTDLGSQMNWFGAVKGRMGLSMPSFLPLFIGGLAYAQIER